MTPSDTPHPPVPDRDDEDEVDPTGIRDLLRALPDPGPMPEELVRRIETRLAVELAHRAPSHPFTETPVAAHGSLVDLDRERLRRRPRRTVVLLGTAAAGLLVATVTVGNLLGSGVVGGADTAAYAPASEAAGRDDAAGGAADEQTQGDGGGMAAPQEDAAQEDAGQEDAGGDTAADEADGAGGGAPAGGQGILPVRVLADLGDVDDAQLAAVLEEAVRAAEDTEQAPTLSAAQANSCWRTVRADDGWQDRHAAAATMDDDPVVVLWATDGAGREHAWLMPGECVVNPDVTALADLALTP